MFKTPDYHTPDAYQTDSNHSAPTDPAHHALTEKPAFKNKRTTRKPVNQASHISITAAIPAPYLYLPRRNCIATFPDIM